MTDPHLEDRHRELLARAQEFGERHLRAVAHAEEDPAGSAAFALGRLAEAGLLTGVVPPRFGTADARSIAALREGLAYFSLAVESVLTAHGLAAHLLSASGSEPQRARWMPALAAGSTLGALAVGEPEAGFDLGAIRTLAAADGSLWRLDGEKSWVTAAAGTRLFVVLARVGPGEGTAGLSLFLVDATAPGFAWRPLETLAALPVGEARLDGAHGVLLGGEGGGAAALESALALFRPGAAAAACGLAARARDEATRHALAHRQRGRSLASYQPTRLALAEMTCHLMAAERLARHAAWLVDRRGADEAGREAAAARIVAVDTAERVVDAAMRVHGTAGLVRGSTVERLSREARALRVREGTNELLKLDLALSILEESR